jgi:hypothetical protein
MIKWHSVKTLPKLRKYEPDEMMPETAMTSDRLLVYVTDHIGFGSFKVNEYPNEPRKSGGDTHKHAFWKIEGHSGDWVVTHWAYLTPPRGVKVRKHE